MTNRGSSKSRGAGRAKKRPAETAKPEQSSYQKLFESHPLPMWVYDLKSLEFLAANDAAVEKYGYSREEFLRMTIRDIRPQEDVARLVANVKKKRPALQHSGEWRHRLRDGTVIEVEIHSHTLEYEGRKAALVMALDVTERKQAERRYQSLFNQSHDAIFILDLQGRHLQANQRAADMLGYTLEEIQHLSVEDTSAEPDASRQIEERLLRGEHIPVYERLFRKKDGSLLPVEINVELVRDAAGNPSHIQSVVRDIAERKQAKAALEKTNELLETIFSHTHLMLAYMDREFNFVRVNRAYAEVDRRTPEFFPGRNHFELYPNAENQAIFQRVVESGEPYFAYAKPFEYAEHPERGLSHWDWSLTPIKDSTGRVGHLLLSLADVTRRVQAEEALRLSEEEYRSLVEQIPAIVYVDLLDGKGTTLFISPQVETLLGVPVQEWLEEDTSIWLELIHPEDRQQTEEAYRQSTLTGQPYEVEYRMITRQGQLIWIQDKGRLLKGSAGETLLHGVMFDITERKQAEEAVERSEKRLSALIEHGRDQISLLTADGALLWENPRTPTMLGYPLNAYRGRNIFELMHPDDAGWTMELFQRVALTPGRSQDGIFRLRHNDGSWRWIEATATNLLEEPTVGAIVVNYRDITERRRTEEARRLAEEKYRSIFEGAVEGIFQSTPEGRFLTVNPALARLWGYDSPEELILTIQDIASQVYAQPRQREEFARLLEEHGEVRGFEYEARRKDGSTLWISEDARAVRAANGMLLYYEGNIQGITERKQAEQALRESEEKLQNIIRHSSSMFYSHTPDHVLTYVSPQSRQILDCEPEEARVRWQEFLSDNPINLQGIEATERAIQTGLRQPPYELELITRKGRRIWVLVDESPVVRDEKTAAIVGSITDITERKRAEKALRESETLLREAQIVAGLGSYVLDIPASAWKSSEMLDRIFGIDERFDHSVAGWAALIHPDDREMMVTYFREEVLGKRRSFDKEYRIVRQNDKAERWVHGLGQLEFDSAGQPVKMHGTIQDITERKEAEEKIAASEAELRALFTRQEAILSAIPDIIMEVDANKVYTWANPAGMEFFGEDVIGREAAYYFEGEQDTYETVAPLFEGKEDIVTIESWQRRRDGAKRLLGWRCQALKDAEGSVVGVLSSAHDITEHHHRQRALEAEALLSQAMGETWELEPLLERLLEAARHAIPAAEKGSIALLTGDDRLQVRAISGYEAGDVLGFTFPVTWGYAGRALRQRRALLITDVREDAELQEDARGAQTAEVQALRSAIVIPLAVRESALGVLSLESAYPNAFDEEDLRLLGGFAASGALILERARLFDESRQRAEETGTLLSTSLALNSLDLQTTLHTIGEHSKALFAADGCRIFLLEPDGRTLRCVLALLESAAAFSDLKINFGEGVTGSVAASGKAEIVNDMLSDPRAVQVPGTEVEPEAIMFAPLRERDRTLGVISIRRVGAQRPFQPADLELLMALASMAASAVSNARLFEESRQRVTELEMLYESGLALNRLLTPKEIGQKVLELLEQKVNWHHTTIRRYHPENETLELLAFNQPGLATPQERQAVEENFNRVVSKPGEGLSGWAIQRSQIVRSGDVSNDPRYVETYLGLHSGLYVPMLLGGHAIGVISIESEQPNAFSEADERLAATLANQAAIALENARLFEETRQRALEQGIIHQASQSLLTSRLDPQSVYRSMHEAVSQIMPCDAFSIVLEEENGGDYQAVYLHDSGRNYPPRRIPRGTGLSGRVISEGKTLYIHDNLAENVSAVHFGSPQQARSILAVPLRKEHEIVGMISTQSYRPSVFTEQHRVLLETLAAQMATAIQNARLFEETRRRVAELETINRISITLRAVSKQDEMLAIVLEETLAALDAAHGSINLLNEQTGKLHKIIARGWPSEFSEAPIQPGEGIFGKVFASGNAYVSRDFTGDPLTLPASREHLPPGWGGACVPIHSLEMTLGIMMVAVPGERELGKDELRLLNTLAEMTGNALHRMRLHEETKRRAEEFASLYETNVVISGEHNLPALLQTVVNSATAMLDAGGGGMYLHDPASGELELVVSTHPSVPIGVRLRLGEGLAGRVAQTRQPLRVDDYSTWEGRAAPFRKTTIHAVLDVPMLFGGEVIGVLVAHEIGDSKRKFTDADERLLSLFAAQAAGAIRSARLREETERRLQNLQSLREVDRVVTSSFDLRPILNTVLSHAITQLGVDAAGVLLLHPTLQTLEYAAGFGFRTRGIERTHLRLGEGHSGRAALERRVIHISNLNEAGDQFQRASLLAGENFLEYYGVPLVSKGEIKGVLEVFHRSPLSPRAEWLDLLETLAGQAAIAIDNSQLFDSIQRSNMELILAYDATIEGWSRAMDLRDEETEGHTQRVTEKAIALARALGLSDDEIIHLRRGALLHDIGKIGIPDHILLKPDKLTVEEWEIMRKHPHFAYEMLRPIAYLWRSLDIPHLHHEKWDGTGYPLGLKGEQIPIAARIFAIADVFDALTSDRPYRKAWSKKDALDYIREQSGKHFDPQVAEKFMELFGDEAD